TCIPSLPRATRSRSAARLNVRQRISGKYWSIVSLAVMMPKSSTPRPRLSCESSSNNWRKGAQRGEQRIITVYQKPFVPPAAAVPTAPVFGFPVGSHALEFAGGVGVEHTEEDLVCFGSPSGAIERLNVEVRHARRRTTVFVDLERIGSVFAPWFSLGIEMHVILTADGNQIARQAEIVAMKPNLMKLGLHSVED